MSDWRVLMRMCNHRILKRAHGYLGGLNINFSLKMFLKSSCRENKIQLIDRI